MSGADPDLPYHLGADASKDCVGGVLFQLHGCTLDEQITPRNRSKMKIIMFLSFRLTDAETRYSNTERECLSIVRCLAETKWLVIGSKYPIKIYTDHEALPPVLTKGTESYGQIATWQDRLNEYDTEVYHQPCTDPMIGIADGLSCLPKRLATDFIPDDAPRMTMPILPDDWTKQSEEKKLAPAYDGQGWEKFNQSPELMRIVYYLRFGKEGLGDMPRSELRALQHRATKFSLGERTGVLLYTERNGARAPCIVGEEIPAILGHLHDGHGHYSHIITLDRLIGEAYWPTRAHDVITWCRSCQACQVRGPKQGKGAMKHILELEPMSMVGLDFLGPINPSCNATNHKYILLAIDYFTRFMWMESYSFCTMIEVADLFRNQIVPVFGWPEAIYSDNGSHFTGQEINTIFQSHGVTHYTAPVTHPSSVGLIERNVQLVLSQLRARCIAAGTPGSWSRYIPEIALSINTRLIQVHGYSPAELLLGYKPKLAHFNIQPLKLPIWMDEMEAEATRTHGLYVALREETRNQATESLATHQGKNEAKRAIPLGLLSPGDLVLVRDTQLDNQRGRKLEARWRGPRMLVQMTKEHLSGWVKPIYENGKMKRYHCQDMKKYVSRVKPGQEGVQTYEPIESNQDDAKLLDDNVMTVLPQLRTGDGTCPTVQYERTAMKHAVFLGQRAVYLSTLRIPAYVIQTEGAQFFARGGVGA